MQFLTSKNKSTLLGTTAFLFAAFVIVTVVTIDEQEEKTDRESTSATSSISSSSSNNEHLQANYFMENYSIISINADGQPHRWLSGEKLSRYPDDTIVLTHPKIQIKTFPASISMGRVLSDSNAVIFMLKKSVAKNKKQGAV